MRAVSSFVVFLALSVALSSECVVSAQNPVADPDFEIQGEYSGDRNSMQVIARGDGEFEIVVYAGPIDQRNNASAPPRRLDGDEDIVADLMDSLDVKRLIREPRSLGAKPPRGATVLFDGSETSLGNWKDGKLSPDGFLQQGTETQKTFRDYTLHLEFRTPWMPTADGQGRGNSGVYHQGRYETQVLDSFGLSGENNEAGAIYEIKAPDTNACLPPMQWQTYDIDFTAARYQDDKKVADARITVRLNGVTVQNDVAIPSATRASKLKEGPEDGPIYLQDHGNPVRYRNIWIVPRDAVREAARPIVPGFERFFANSDDSIGLGGELLISSLACTSCHAGAEGVLPMKKGPDLSQVRQRVRPDALVKMIADPHKTKRGTTMPDPWMGLNADQRQTAAKAIASYLSLTGQQADLVDFPARSSSIKQGNKLYHSVGCVACHSPLDDSTTPASTTVPLGDLATKYTVDSLADFIAKPHSVRSGGRMPSLVGSMGDSYAIASYLTRSVTRRNNDAKFRRRIYKGEWSKLPDFDALTPVTDDQVSKLEVKGEQELANTGMVFESQIRIAFAGKYEFSISSDDGSRLKVGSHTVDNDGIHGMITKSGSFELEPGLYPIRVEWFNAAGGVGLNATVNDPRRGVLSLQEVISDGKNDELSLLASDFQPDPSLVAQGRGFFLSSGCASCHNFQDQKAMPRKMPALVDMRLDRGCLADSVSRPAVDFHLSPKQKVAIGNAIQLRKSNESTSTSITDQDLVHITMAGLNCYACHQRDGIGGPEATRNARFQTTTAEMGWESRLPPPLDGVGDKLNQTYLGDLFANGADERPYMLTRMPGFGEGNLDLLHKSIARLDEYKPGDDEVHAHAAASADSIPDGRKLIGAGGLSCVKCHAYAGLKGGGIGVIDLLAMPKRLREDWFARYLQDPTKYRPGTRMPNSFPEGRSSYTKLYDGNPDKQVAAMWTYLKAGKAAKEPQGLRAGSILLNPNDRPVIYRNFFEGVTGRGIAVGYPDQVNLIWDAERMGLNSIWKSEFIDAAQHWTGRGQGRTTPAGDQASQIEPWSPIVAGDTIDMTWPTESARELGHRFKGYWLDPSGNPEFRYEIDDARISDAIVPTSEGSFERTLTITRETGSKPIGLVWRLASADIIVPTDDGFTVGNVNLSVTGIDCEIVTVGGKRELRALIPDSESVTIKQQIRW